VAAFDKNFSHTKPGSDGNLIFVSPLQFKLTFFPLHNFEMLTATCFTGLRVLKIFLDSPHISRLEIFEFLFNNFSQMTAPAVDCPTSITVLNTGAGINLT
jgi:hypothetical protein